MSAEEGFLARWSRRKRAAEEERKEAPEMAAGAPPRALPAAVPPDEGAAKAMPPELPPLASIEASSDIRAFLAPEVPTAVTRAALRRAWSTDPAIRDFIGLSENSWDFTQPDAVPGFGTLSAEEIDKLIAQATGEAKAPEAARDAAAAQSAAAEDAAAQQAEVPETPHKPAES
jgi:hypothetical protein